MTIRSGRFRGNPDVAGCAIFLRAPPCVAQSLWRALGVCLCLIGPCLDGGVGAAGWRARTLRDLQVWAGRTVPLSFCLPESAAFMLGRTRVISLVLPPFRGGCVRAPPNDPTQAWSATLVAFRSEPSSGDFVMPCVSPTSKPISFQNLSFLYFSTLPSSPKVPSSKMPGGDGTVHVRRGHLWVCRQWWRMFQWLHRKEFFKAIYCIYQRWAVLIAAERDTPCKATLAAVAAGKEMRRARLEQQGK